MIGNKYRLGIKTNHSDETKCKISESLKGMKHSEESYKRQGDKIRGRKASVETRKKLSVFQSNRRKEERKNKLSETINKE